MSSTATLLGTPGEFTFEGQTYKVAPRDFRHEGAFQRWLEQEALLAVQRHRGDMSVLEYDAAFSGWRNDCAAGQFEWGQMISYQRRYTASGWHKLAYLALKEFNPEVTEALIDRIARDREAKKRLTNIMDVLVGEAQPDPNVQMPAQAEAPAQS